MPYNKGTFLPAAAPSWAVPAFGCVQSRHFGKPRKRSCMPLQLGKPQHNMGIRGLPRLLQQAAQQHVSCRAAAVPKRLRCCRVHAASSLAEPACKTLFSSRAKVASGCAAWLKDSKSRSTLIKKLQFEQVYEGDVSNVLIATCKTNQEKVVIKSFHRCKLVEKLDLQHKVKQEWEIHSNLQHPNIIQAYLGMEDSSSVKIFMEYAGDSDAYSYINAKQRLSLREDDARVLVYDVLDALKYMHSQGIVHRDIKSENVFRTASGIWKLGDFGSSLRIGDDRVMEKQVLKLEGTFSFAAPEYITIWNAFSREQLLKATSFKLDSWSVGALAYDVLCGHAPFAEHENISREEEKKNILYKEPEYPSGLSYDAVSFMMQALEKNRQKRPSIAQLQAHPWFDDLVRQRARQAKQQQ